MRWTVDAVSHIGESAVFNLLLRVVHYGAKPKAKAVELSIWGGKLCRVFFVGIDAEAVDVFQVRELVHGRRHNAVVGHAALIGLRYLMP